MSDYRCTKEPRIFRPGISFNPGIVVAKRRSRSRHAICNCGSGETWEEVKVVNYTRFWHLEGGDWIDVALRYDHLPILRDDK